MFFIIWLIYGFISTISFLLYCVYRKEEEIPISSFLGILFVGTIIGFVNILFLIQYLDDKGFKIKKRKKIIKEDNEQFENDFE